MRFHSLALVALSAAGALAVAEEKRQIPVVTDSVGFSVLSVLATAIPASDQSAALANRTAFALAVASSIAAGTPPAWYNALPSDVKSLLPSLYPAPTPAMTTSAASETGASSASSSASVGTISSGVTNTTAATSFQSPTLSSTEGGASETSGAPASTGTSASGNGAAYPTAVLGAGVAGALGVLGMLAL
ncbi:hypothetical protein EJ04DRAFT_513379 [Polyplosphaeria fusca]|uniref:Uncharacterized protein n=1 Tax=Polyplosphaeria fusca TaxID=682080 RepID=A0A9P4V1G1_9PLEO|nr:hypothetical protein EJ04DRAFT_513379 [Polyplosphaeria fusca]